MPLAARIGSWLFCHSGFLPQLSWQDLKTNAASTLNAGNYGDPLLSDEQSILEAKKWETNPEQKNLLLSRLNANGFQGVVFGHQPKALGIKGKCGMSSDGRLIKIDNGMAPEAGSHPGSMLEFLKPKDLNHFKSPKVKAIDARGRSTSLPISDAA